VNKAKILAQLVSELETLLASTQLSAKVARDAATHVEAKAENKYDTRGLESSYLASAQSRRAQEISGDLRTIRGLLEVLPPSSGAVAMTSLVTVLVNGATQKILLILPTAGGLSFVWETHLIQIVTAASPIGKRLIGCKVGEIFEMIAAGKPIEYEVCSIE
jgi:transcription elongation GreA/GreB family factor